MQDYSRRRLLQAGAGSAAVALAGCNALGDEDDTDAEADDQYKPFTVAVQPDEDEAMQVQQEFRLAQQEINQRTQAGELNQTEAQEELQVAQREAQEELEALQSDAVEAVEDHVDETESLTVEDTLPSEGFLLVGGEADAALELLEHESVGGLLPGEHFEEVQGQQELELA